MKSEIVKTAKFELSKIEAVAIQAMIEDGVSKRKDNNSLDHSTDRFIKISTEFIAKLDELTELSK